MERAISRPETVRIVHSQISSTPEQEINEAQEALMFDVMIDTVRQANIFAEIELAEDKSARWIRVEKRNVDRARHILQQADTHGELQDRANERTEWYF